MILEKLFETCNTSYRNRCIVCQHLGYLNDVVGLDLMLMDRSDMQPLQMLLRTMMSNIQFLQTMSEQSSEAQAMLAYGSWAMV